MQQTSKASFQLMKSKRNEIILLRGSPGSGKSQVAKSLCDFFPKGVKLEVDTIRSMVISVDWTNQAEHINILHLSTKLAYNFIQLGFNPVIVVDTFSGNKIQKFIEDLHQLDKLLFIKIFGLFTTEEELKKRIKLRKKGEFRNYKICKKLNEETLKFKYEGEIQINTTGLTSKDVAEMITLKV